ncbi:MAG: urease accessory protein UreD [Polyangiales bacterium]
MPHSSAQAVQLDDARRDDLCAAPSPLGPLPAPASADDLATHGLLEVTWSHGQSAVTRARAASPLKLLVPRSKSEVARISIATYGGGMLAGDETRLRVRLRPGAKAIVSTQSSTKVFKSVDGRTTRQSLTASLEPGAIGAFVPDPIACFADARYAQCQRFDVVGDATLLVLDWFTSGRRARGEIWGFEHYSSRQQVFLDGHRIIEDAIRLDRSEGAIGGRFRGGRYHCQALLMLVGQRTQAAVERLRELAGRQATHGAEARRGLLVVANPVTHGVLLRVAGEETEAVAQFITGKIEPCLELFDTSIWGRKF